jgi:hypothetical protein
LVSDLRIGAPPALTTCDPETLLLSSA